MKEKILALLAAKFADVTSAILERIANKKAESTATAERTTTLIEGLTLQNAFDFSGDSRATEATQPSVANYEKRHNDGESIRGEDEVYAAKRLNLPNYSELWM